MPVGLRKDSTGPAAEIEQSGSAISADCLSGATCAGSLCTDRSLALDCTSINGRAYECAGRVSADGGRATGTCTGPITCSSTFTRVER